MAGRNRAVLSGSSGNALSEGDEGSGYTYLPWVDLICAGVPCQDVSVAGKRAGLAGERTGLFYDFARLLREIRPTWFLFENVPGLLSSNRGRDFAEVLRVLMVECGYGVQWRVLNSQFFGVAQRRRRLFVVGYFGKPCPPEILFEPESRAGNFETGSETRPELAYEIAASLRSSGGGERGFMFDAEVGLAVTANALSASAGHHGHSSPRGDGSDNLILGRDTANGHSRLLHAGEGSDDARETAFCLRSDPGGTGQGHNTTYAITENMRNRSQGPGNYITGTLNSGGNSGGFRTEPGEHLHVSAAPYPNGVRDFTRLPLGMDSARYRALGNAVTVKVIRWIAERILKSRGLGK